jgi:hypothetical protein
VIRRLVAPLALAVLLGAPALAGKSDLLPAGNTIGGPGVATIDPGADVLVFRQSDATPLNLCATIVQLGAPSTEVLASVVEPGSTYNASSVRTKGDAVTVCRNGSNQVRISCTSPGPSCKARWRVDRLP